MPNLPDVNQLLPTWIDAIRGGLRDRGIPAPRIIGIQTGGVLLAERLAEALVPGEPIGRLDIAFHRDDHGQRLAHPRVLPSTLPWSIEGEPVLLVDDVLFSGRTIRAALNEIFDWGRPSLVMLAVLVARNGRQLPVAADFTGTTMDLPLDQHVKLRGSPDLHLEIVHAGGRP